MPWRRNGLIAKYKFYLSFENSIHCNDYISEKFWRNALGGGAVPVVFGPHIDDVRAIAPPKSFIHAEEFRFGCILFTIELVWARLLTIEKAQQPSWWSTWIIWLLMKLRILSTMRGGVKRHPILKLSQRLEFLVRWLATFVEKLKSGVTMAGQNEQSNL